MKQQSFKKGDHIQFIHPRITRGNPVTGKFLTDSDGWLTIKLTKEIEGLVTLWGKGDKYTCRKSLISDIEKVNEAIKNNKK